MIDSSTYTPCVLITGGAKRIGAALALHMAGKCWDIALHYHRSGQEAKETAARIEALGRKVWLVQADLADHNGAASIFPHIKRMGVRVDCLIHNASLFEKDNLETVDGPHWHAHMEVNLHAPLILTRDFAGQYMGEQGNILYITDGMKGWSLSPVFLSYTLSKQGLENATRLLAPALAPRIRINCIAPGPTLEGAQDDEGTFAKLREILPMRRTGSTEELCAAADYLLSAPSVTGQVLSLAGGL